MKNLLEGASQEFARALPGFIPDTGAFSKNDFGCVEVPIDLPG